MIKISLFFFSFLSIMGRNKNRNLNYEPEYKELYTRLKDATYWLDSQGFLILLSYSNQDQQSRGDKSKREPGPLYQTSTI